VADGRGTEWSPAAADRGRRRRPQLGEVVQEVAGGRISGKATTISSLIVSPGRATVAGQGRYGGGSPPLTPASVVAAAAAWAVAQDWCVEAEIEGGGGRHGGRRPRLQRRREAPRRGRPAPGALQMARTLKPASRGIRGGGGAVRRRRRRGSWLGWPARELGGVEKLKHGICVLALEFFLQL
jgi:hypothetical protein